MESDKINEQMPPADEVTGMPEEIFEKKRGKRNENEYYSAKPKLGKKGPSLIRQRFTRGITYFLVIAASIAFYFALLRLTNISEYLYKIIDVLKPVIYGCVFAYLLNPIVENVDRALVPYLSNKLSDKKKAQSYSRIIGIIFAIVLLITVIVTLCNMLLPELYKSIRDLIFTLPGQMNAMVNNINEYAKADSTTGYFFKQALNQGTTAVQNWLRTDLLSKINDLMGNLTEGVINVLGEIVNGLLGIIISVYILSSKEQFSRQCKKMIYAVFSPDHANMILHITNKSNDIFGGFIIGKIIDSVIIGVLCFFGLSILKLPYVVLISVIVGVTNVIPFFGPYIGAIPCTILLLLNNPLQALYFVIFILILQQVDGNIIGPKILGSSTGLSPFWVVVAILIGGGLFGFVGMLIGVPAFGVVYYLFTLFLNGKLEAKKLPVQSDMYDTKSYVDEKGVFYGSEIKKEDE